MRTYRNQPSGTVARARFLETQGYTVLRFWNPDVMTNTDGVLSRIAAFVSDPFVSDKEKGRAA